jgi:hypothetical protein
MSKKRIFGVIVLSILMIAFSGIPAKAEEGTVTAMSAWQGRGQVFKVGEHEALFVGGFGGIMFLEDRKGVLDAAKIICPGTMEINLEDGSQKGEGRCIITSREGDRVFAKWNCEGVHLQGCEGKFNLTGGTGKLEGITGESDFTIRSAIGEITVKIPSTEVYETAIGLAFWPKLHYKIP